MLFKMSDLMKILGNQEIVLSVKTDRRTFKWTFKSKEEIKNRKIFDDLEVIGLKYDCGIVVITTRDVI